jgi:phosphatidylserine decarboxylase
MSDTPERLPLEAMDPQLTSIQPGGGVIVHWELWWGKWRRWWLKTFRKGYVKRMAEKRIGDTNGCPHEVLDPRDLKFYLNQPNYSWKPEDDPFAWRDRLPFARVGLAELIVFTFITLVPAAGVLTALLTQDFSVTVATVLWIVFAGLLFCGGEVIWFFRNPRRTGPDGPGDVLSPADGKIVEIKELEHDEYIGGPAIQIGIFLSIFNVHINRSPIAARTIGMTYKPGEFLNALNPESAIRNERLEIRLEANDATQRRMIVRQIAGLIARRIVCRLKPGDDLARGEQFGMIKLGSRTELVIPKTDGLKIVTQLGDKVNAGASLMANYSDSKSAAN